MTAFAFHPAALQELQEQALLHEERVEGLGERFTAQVEASVQRAASMPGIGSPYRCGTRRVFPQDFPFSVVYREIGGVLVVIAVAAFRRRPGYWRERR